MNPGIETGIMRTDGVDFAGHANMKESDSMVVRSNPIIMQSLKGNAETDTCVKEELSFANSDEVQAKYKVDGLHDHTLLSVDKPTDEFGPSTSKPKTTWTRINRMDFGLGGLARAITLPSLGKRDTRENISGQNEEHETKRGRVLNEEGNFVDISVGVDSHPC